MALFFQLSISNRGRGFVFRMASLTTSLQNWVRCAFSLVPQWPAEFGFVPFPAARWLRSAVCPGRAIPSHEKSHALPFGPLGSLRKHTAHSNQHTGRVRFAIRLLAPPAWVRTVICPIRAIPLRKLRRLFACYHPFFSRQSWFLHNYLATWVRSVDPHGTDIRLLRGDWVRSANWPACHSLRRSVSQNAPSLRLPRGIHPGSDVTLKIPMQLEKVYEPQRFEPHWAQWWIESGIYKADASRAQQGRMFSIVIPPPNVTGQLHIGHMFEHTMMDVAVRWHRMKGEATLWLPGTDHAGISTQMVVERQLATENITRQQLGRTDLNAAFGSGKRNTAAASITKFAAKAPASIGPVNGSHWTPGYRARFAKTSSIYGTRASCTAATTWSTGARAAKPRSPILKPFTKPSEGNLWHIRYAVSGSNETLIVATTRPETMLGDTAVFVHPDDARYQHLIGKTAILPIMNREIPISRIRWSIPNLGPAS